MLCTNNIKWCTTAWPTGFCYMVGYHANTIHSHCLVLLLDATMMSYNQNGKIKLSNYRIYLCVSHIHSWWILGGETGTVDAKTGGEIWGHTSLGDIFLEFVLWDPFYILGGGGTIQGLEIPPTTYVLILAWMYIDVCLWQIQYLQSELWDVGKGYLRDVHRAIFEGSIHCFQMLQVHTSPHQYTHHQKYWYKRGQCGNHCESTFQKNPS